MKDISTIEQQFENELIKMRRQASDFATPAQYLRDKQLKDTGQAIELAGDNTDLNNGHVSRLFYWTARERARSHRWNVNALILSYCVLIIVIILTLSEANELIVGSIAVLGMVTLWLFSWLQSKKMEKQFYQQEVNQYLELLSNEAKNNLNGVETLPSTDSVESPLTKRELEVLKLAATGKINKEIGSELGISEETVKNHLVHIFTKLDVNDRTAAVVMAIIHHWIQI